MDKMSVVQISIIVKSVLLPSIRSNWYTQECVAIANHILWGQRACPTGKL